VLDVSVEIRLTRVEKKLNLALNWSVGLTRS